MTRTSTYTFLALLVILLCTQGCGEGGFFSDSIGDKAVDQIKDESTKTLEDLKRILSDLTPSQDQIQNLTNEEISKLSVLEYRVFELDKDPATIDLENLLADAGRERWECFGIMPGEKSMRILCKRRPETYLRYIPRLFP